MVEIAILKALYSKVAMFLHLLGFLKTVEGKLFTNCSIIHFKLYVQTSIPKNFSSTINDIYTMTYLNIMIRVKFLNRENYKYFKQN